MELSLTNRWPVSSFPYRDGHKVHEFEKPKFDQILVTNVIKPVKKEWASPIVFVPKKIGYFPSVLVSEKLTWPPLGILPYSSYGGFYRLDWQCKSTFYTRSSQRILACRKDGRKSGQNHSLLPSRPMKTYHHAVRPQKGTRNFSMSDESFNMRSSMAVHPALFSWRCRKFARAWRTGWWRTICFDVLCETSVAPKLMKCKFSKNWIDYIRQFILPEPIELSGPTIDKICESLPPLNVRVLRSPLGLCHVFRGFFPSIAIIPPN